ncbi:methyltransferase domain-containing protein [Streptomyces eurocidicus]|uniref:SAM-dependent methyltransferase n=1 Tax=Streptomyces eurocidicus TaxID=66423 RepID=A0A7W8BD43_STREU|nr:methyltransferase domain-containing protein [Streptomyces eurocidicus]MBB5119249.1 SAM-dependent methyltransferase [Streptomyces eurocidicus]MBF6053163.1 methyltransferase domain-containing protein [Streptomyces eurocidicus]
MSVTARHFSDVDKAPSPAAYEAYLELAERSAPVTALRAHIAQRLGRPPGHGVDVGCGTGHAVAELRAAGLTVTGLDRSDSLVRTARTRFAVHGCVVGDAMALPFPAGRVGWYRAERLLIHLPDAGQALEEARRVLRPGGRVALADPDFATLAVASDHPATTGPATEAFTEALADGRAGAHHGALLRRAGFTDLTRSTFRLAFTTLAEAWPLLMEPACAAGVGAGVLGVEQVAALRGEQEARDVLGLVEASCAVHVTTALRP